MPRGFVSRIPRQAKNRTNSQHANSTAASNITPLIVSSQGNGPNATRGAMMRTMDPTSRLDLNPVNPLDAVSDSSAVLIAMLSSLISRNAVTATTIGIPIRTSKTRLARPKECVVPCAAEPDEHERGQESKRDADAKRSADHVSKAKHPSGQHHRVGASRCQRFRGQHDGGRDKAERDGLTKHVGRPPCERGKNGRQISGRDDGSRRDWSAQIRLIHKDPVDLAATPTRVRGP